MKIRVATFFLTLIFLSVSCAIVGIGGSRVYIKKSKEKRIGKLAALELEKMWKRKEYPKGFRKYVNDVAQRVRKSVGGPGFKFEFLEAKERFSVVLPGGYIYITDGLLKELSSEGELASIFALALSHIENEDARAFLSGQFGVELIEKLSFKVPLTQTEENIVRQAIIAAFYDYGRERQMKAEEEALNILIHSGYNPLSLLRVIKKLDPPPITPSTSLTFLKDEYRGKKERIDRLNNIVGNFEASILNLPFFEDVYDSIRGLYLR